MLYCAHKLYQHLDKSWGCSKPVFFFQCCDGDPAELVELITKLTSDARYLNNNNNNVQDPRGITRKMSDKSQGSLDFNWFHNPTPTRYSVGIQIPYYFVPLAKLFFLEPLLNFFWWWWSRDEYFRGLDDVQVFLPLVENLQNTFQLFLNWCWRTNGVWLLCK